MIRFPVFLLIALYSFTLFSQTAELKEDMMISTGLDEGNFLIQGFSLVNRAEYLPAEFRSMASTLVDIPLRFQVLAPSPVRLIELFLKGGLEENHKVLLVGEECAYPAAALSRAGMEVYLIDPTAPPSSSYQLKKDLTNLKGWISMAPFDFILVLNHPRETVPQALTDQLSSGGILIVPLKTPLDRQNWVKIVSKGGNRDISLMDDVYPLPLF